jgi:hypothetical protein
MVTSRIDLYATAWIDRKPTVFRMLKGFNSRIEVVSATLGETREVRQAVKQLQKVAACKSSYENTNGKTFWNLFLASAKLNEQLCDLEREARYVGDCDICAHLAHRAGTCSLCGCGESEVVGAY